jgi:hypothetical protein
MKITSLRFALCLTVAVAGGMVLQTAFAAEPGHMDKALGLLKSARFELNQASRDKGGHRTEAVRLIDQAIEQVKLGIDVGERHGDGG